MNNKIGTKITSGILLGTMLAYSIPVFAYTKEETVYAKLDTNGSCYQTTVSNHLKNTDNEEFLKDLSDLVNIENVSGDEKFEKSENTVTWNAKGNDIYYKGESKKELPIECKVTYMLDEKEISKEEIVGKSGNVKIILEYTNKEEHIVNINGKNVKMYTPFVVACGTIINNENNKNIEISNGKIVDDGTKTMVFGLAIPGMQESLNISKDKVNIPNKVEISMEAKDFEMNSIYAFITPKILEEKDIKAFDKIDSIYSKVNTLQSSMNMVEDGANTLKNGTNTYYEKSKEFNNAMNKVTVGVNTINENYEQIDNGISSLKSGSTEVSNGASKLNEGINILSASVKELPDNVSKLYAGTTQVLIGLNGTNEKVGLVDGLNEIINSLNKTTENLIEQLDNLSKTDEKVIDDLKENNKTIENSINELENNNNSLQKAIDSLSKTEEDITENNLIIENLKEQKTKNNAQKSKLQKQKESNLNKISTYTTSKKTAEGTKQYIINTSKESSSSLKSVKDGMNTIKNTIGTINGGLGQLNTASKELPEAIEQISNGSKTLANGSKVLTKGSKTLSEGSTAIKSGMNTLNASTKALNSANGQLTQGAEVLSEGATTLSSGITTLNKEGITPICNKINGDVKDLQIRLEKLQELANEYNNFTMINEEAEGNVKFIMMIDSLKKNEDKKEEAIIEEKRY